jgi:tryptophan synthase alpha subunit
MPNTKAVGVAFSDPELDGAVIGTSGGTVGFYGTTPVAKGAALTAQLTTISSTAPVTPDYAIQDLVNSSAFGFVTKDEGNTVLSVIKNLQDRVGQLEARLQAYGLLP